MSRKEVPRAGLLKGALAGQISNVQGAHALRLSLRQFHRLKRRYAAEGARGLLHRGRGRASRRRLPPEVWQQVAELLRSTYQAFNDCHATEKLREVEELRVSRESVRRIRRALGLPAKHRRRPRQHRARRTPEARMGALVQLDGSPFDWLQGRGPELTLLGAIDDATATVLALHFRPTEDLHGYTTLLHQIGTLYGLPLTLYGDRLNVFTRNDPHWTLEEELQGRQHPTHFGRILQELGIGYVPAGSPQAKGRIERLWRTLQDRLVSELRLRALATCETANAFLPEFLADFNQRFAHAPADTAPAWRRPPRDVAHVLSCRYSRVVARDNTVRLGPRWIPIPRGPAGRSYAGCRVELRELLDGRAVVLYHNAVIASQPAPSAAFVLTPRSDPGKERTRRLHASQSVIARGARPVGRGAPAAPRPSQPPASRRPARPTPPAATHPWRRLLPLSRRARALIAQRRDDIFTGQLP